MQSKINAITYCDSLDMLSVGLSNGMIVSYTLEIESFVYSGSSPVTQFANLAIRTDSKRQSK